MRKPIFILTGLICFAVLWPRLSVVYAGSLSVRAVVGDTDVYVGEPLTLQIRVSGSESPEKPDLSHIDGFTIAFQGGSQNSSSSIQIINGRMTRDVRKGYIFSYRLTPLRKGRLIIPPITVHADNDTASTRPISITARQPEKTDHFKMRLMLSKTRCYVGEPVILIVTWYLETDVQSAKFTLPLLEKADGFYIADPKVDTGSGGQFYRIPLNGSEVIARKGQDNINGQAYGTLSFKKVLIPRKSGTITIDPATVSFKALVGYRQRKSPFDDDFFSNFFNDNFFSMGRQGVYKQLVVSSNSLQLHILDLPAAGKPADFSGLVGEYHMTATAQPTAVNVGDPITLALKVSGPKYLEPVQLPPLSRQPRLSRDFKIPAERATGEISGHEKVFSQTIRPLRPDIKAIPPITLSYFDTGSETYKTIQTRAIPLSVRPTRIVTAKDAEGLPNRAPAGTVLETFSAGIAHNYEDERVLLNQIHDPLVWLTSHPGLGTLVLPPALYLIVVVLSFFYRRHKADPAEARAKSARSRFTKTVNSARHAKTPQQGKAEMLDAFKTYLGDKLRIPAGALTLADVRDPIARKGADPATLAAVENIFSECEAARYGSGGSDENGDRIFDKAINLVAKLEKILR